MTATVLGHALGRRQGLREDLLLVLPALLLAAAAMPFRYEVTLAEPDLVRMMAALVYGSATGLEEAAGMHYGLKFSFGYYKLLYAIAPEGRLRDPDLAARLINGAGVVSGLLCAWACTLYLSRIFGVAVAVAATAMFFLSPALLAVALSGHPLFPAAACLFAAGWLLARPGESAGTARAWPFAAAAWALLVLGLTMRAEIVLAFPFVWLAAGGRHVRRGLVLAAAFAAFLFLQRAYVADSGGAAGALGAFLESFMSLTRMTRGVVVLVLATGIVTMLGAALAAWRLRGRWRELGLLFVLAAPALALWLPNPQPARHFFFAGLAFCLLVALGLQAWQRTRARLLASALLAAVANQAAAELVHPAIASRYAWSYPPVLERRATQQVPIGALPFDQRANQALARTEREEALRIAVRLPERLLILADFHHYLIAHLVAGDPGLRWSEQEEEDGILLATLRSPRREIVLVQKYGAWPRDVAAQVLADPRWQGWPVHVQPTTVSRFDRTPTPPERAYR